jgi:hypothetical protein
MHQLPGVDMHACKQQLLLKQLSEIDLLAALQETN